MRKENISDLLSEAEIHSSIDSFLKQIEIYKKVLEMDEKNSTALTNITDCYLKLELPEHAKEHALKAYTLYGDTEDRTVVNYSCVLIDCKNYEEAITILEKVKAKNSNDYLVYNNLGYTYFLAKQYNNAMENYNISIQLEENNPLAYCNRGNLKYTIFKDPSGVEDLKKAYQYGDFEAGMILKTVVKETVLLS